MAVAGTVGASMGPFVFYSLVVAVPASLIGGVLYSKLTVDKFFPNGFEIKEDSEAAAKAEASNGPKPSGQLAIGLILLPILLILLGTVAGAVIGDKSPAVTAFFTFIGDKNIALFIGVLVAVFALKKYLKRPLEDVLTEGAAQAGMVFLITGAGGSFGQIINSTGIGEYLVNVMGNFNIPLILLAFLLSQILRAAQGSATVALVTTASIVAPTIAAVGASPVLVGLATCCGSVAFSLPNDSGFWVINRFSGFSFAETFKTWTIGGLVAGLSGFVVVLILSLFAGVLPGL